MSTFLGADQTYDGVAATISKDKSLLFSINEKKQIQIINIKTKAVVATSIENDITISSSSTVMAISNNGKFIAIGNDYKVYIWSVEEEKIIHTFFIDGFIPHFSFSPSTEQIAVLISYDTINLYQIRQELAAEEAQKSNVKCIAISLDGQLVSIMGPGILGMLSREGRLIIDIYQSLEKKYQHCLEYDNGLKDSLGWSGCVSSQNEMLAVSTGSKEIFVWKIKEREITILKNEWYVSAVVFLNNEYLFAGSFESNSITLWSITEKREVGRYTDPMLETGHNDGSGITSISLSSAGHLFALGARDKAAEVWANTNWLRKKSIKLNFKTDKMAEYLRALDVNASAAINCMTFTIDEESLIAGCTDGNIYIWNVANNIAKKQIEFEKGRYFPQVECIVIKAHAETVTGVVHLFTGEELDKERLISVSTDCSVRIWSMLDNRCIFQLNLYIPILELACCSLLNRIAILTSDNVVMMWQLNFSLNAQSDLTLLWRYGRGNLYYEDASISNLNNLFVDDFVPAKELMVGQQLQEEKSDLSLAHLIRSPLFASTTNKQQAISQEKSLTSLKSYLVHKYKLENGTQRELEKGLRRAAFNGKAVDINYFLKLGVDIDVQDARKRKTALHRAVERKHFDCIQILLEKNASCNLIDMNNKTVLDYVKECEDDAIIHLFLSLKNLQEKPRAVRFF